MIELFNILVLDLTSGTVRLQLLHLTDKRVVFAPPIHFTRRPQLHSTPTLLSRRTMRCSSGWNPYQYPWFENTLSRHGFVTSAFIEPADSGAFRFCSLAQSLLESAAFR